MMKKHISILLVMGITASLLILAGCASNPMTSTQTFPVVDNSPQESNTDCSDTSNDNVCYGGNDVEINTEVSKYEDENNDDEVLPVRKN